MRIGLFDSGIGGFSVLESLLENSAGGEIVYVADTLRAPYGTKSFIDLKGFAKEIVGFLIEKDVDIIVSACNTLDSVVKLASFKIPIPYLSIIDSAVEMVKTDRVAILATDFTVKSGIYRSSLKAKEVFQKSAQLLVTTAEMGIRSGKMLDAILKNYVSPVSRWRPSELILGCTHFSFYRRDIESISRTRVIDPARGIARSIDGRRCTKFVVFYVTGDVRDFERKIKRLGLHRRISYSIERLDLKTLERGQKLLEEDNSDIWIVGGR